MQVEELLTPILSFVENTGDASYAVSVVSLIKNAVQLSSRPGIPTIYGQIHLIID